MEQGSETAEASLEQVKALLEKKREAAVEKELHQIEVEERRRLSATAKLHDNTIEGLRESFSTGTSSSAAFQPRRRWKLLSPPAASAAFC